MQLLCISVGKIQNIFDPQDPQASKKPILSAIHKTPISTLALPMTVLIHYLGVDSDEQANLQVHGGEEKAIYAYASEHYLSWQEQLNHRKAGSSKLTTLPELSALPELPELPFGSMGENLTVLGFKEDTVFVGDQWLIGNVVLEVASFREPCFKFNIKMGWAGAAKAMIQMGAFGWYLRVIQSGIIQAGEIIRVTPGPRRLSIRQQSQAFYAKAQSA